MKIILGFIGPIASGKGTAAEYLKEKYGARSYRFSSALRDIANRLYVEQSRENLQNISTGLRQALGDDVLARSIAEEVKADPNDIAVVDGIRRNPDITHLRHVERFYLVSIDADIKTRYERLTKRNENPDDATKTFEEFEADNRKEAELQIIDVMKEAKFSIDNNGDQGALYRQIEDILARIRQ